MKRKEPNQIEYCQFVGCEKAEGDRQLTFTITTAAIDRSADIVTADGWNFDNWQKNPVVLWAHDQRQPPVARGVKIWREGDVHKSTVEFTPADVYPFGFTIYQLCLGGFLQASSVGFNPTKWNWAEDKDRSYGIDFLEKELLEFSIVPIPANPEALIAAKSAGIDTSLIEKWAQEWVKPAEQLPITTHKFMPAVGRRMQISR